GRRVLDDEHPTPPDRRPLDALLEAVILTGLAHDEGIQTPAGRCAGVQHRCRDRVGAEGESADSSPLGRRMESARPDRARRRPCGTSWARPAITLYCTPGTEMTLPALTSSRQSRTSQSASSHIALGSLDMSSLARSCSSVWVNPGHSAVAETPDPASSCAKVSVKAVHQALAAAYVPIGTKPATDDTLMMAPRPRSFIDRAPACESTRTARQRTSSMASSSARSPRSRLLLMTKPAVLTSRSMGRSRSAARAATRRS